MTTPKTALLARFETHLALKDSSPGFHLSNDDYAEIVDALRDRCGVPNVRLEARPADDSQEWTEIYPAQLEWVVRQGHQVRAIETPQPQCGVQSSDDLWAAVRQRDANINTFFAALKTEEDGLLRDFYKTKRDILPSDVTTSFNRLRALLRTPTNAQAAPETGLNWALSDEAKKHIEEIERNIREAPQNIARAQGLIGGTHLCGHGVMAVNCPTCSISSAHSPCEAGK